MNALQDDARYALAVASIAHDARALGRSEAAALEAEVPVLACHERRTNVERIEHGVARSTVLTVAEGFPAIARSYVHLMRRTQREIERREWRGLSHRERRRHYAASYPIATEPHGISRFLAADSIPVGTPVIVGPDGRVRAAQHANQTLLGAVARDNGDGTVDVRMGPTARRWGVDESLIPTYVAAIREQFMLPAAPNPHFVVSPAVYQQIVERVEHMDRRDARKERRRARLKLRQKRGRR